MATMSRRAAAALLAAAATTGCTAAPRQGVTHPTSAPANRGGVTATAGTTTGGTMTDGQKLVIDERGRRTDLEPLTRRFAALGTPESATWMSGTVGDDRAVGPMSYFIDAVVVLAPDAAARLRSRAGALTPREVDLTEPLRADLPTGPFTGSRALDLALSSTRWTASGAFAADGRTLVLWARGEG